MGFDHKIIEKKWQKIWEDKKTFECNVYDFSKPKYYALDMFPYPSGQGLHVGHPEGYTATDIVCRMKRLQGYNVLHPMGWDSFGLPAEQYAIKTGNHPSVFTEKNINRFREQIKSFGFSIDWSKEIATSSPEYYKWTQWIFLQLYKSGLAYIDYKPVNFCPELGTVLANEEVIDGKSEVGGFEVIRKPMRQWVLKITDYADKLLEHLDDLKWPTSTLDMQKNWIGKSYGSTVIFKIKDTKETFEVFTTRVDTLYGCTYCCLAPEHPLVKKLVSKEQEEQVLSYLKAVEKKSDLERTELSKEKSGVFLGRYAINPINNKEVPIFVADYVLGSYGSGAVMAVPAHDDRDYEFAKKHNLNMIQVLEGDISSAAMIEDAKHINSNNANGLMISEAKEVILNDLIKMGCGRKEVHYKLRDWLFSRQRYWGEPIPIVIMNDNSLYPVNDNELPVTLPNINEYKPSGTGESPLVHAKEWLRYEVDGKEGSRETNTMPQWAGSCWYYIRYLDPKNDKEIADPKLIDHWLPVDLYIGGSEHAVLHLLYARFWHRFLYDKGIVKCEEPFTRLFHQGIILGSNGEKMSKSRGNVVNPDDIIEKYGADTLRLYEMFMGPLEAMKPWSDQGLEGSRKFLDRVYRLFTEKEFSKENDHKLDYIFNFTVKKVSEDYENLQFNTAISQMMIFVNECYKAETLYVSYMEDFIKLLYPIAPHICAEIWEITGHDKLLEEYKWPSYDESKLVLNEVKVAVSVNGKLRDTIDVNIDTPNSELESIAKERPNVKKYIDGHQIIKVIVVPNKIVNIVIK